LARQHLAAAETVFDRARTPLPDRLDEAAIEQWLVEVRAEHYDLPRLLDPS
jgi:hypothetical protein